VRIGSLSRERFGNRKRRDTPVIDITFIVKRILLGKRVGHLELSLVLMSDGGIYCPDAGGLFEHGELFHGGDGLFCCRGNVTTFPFVFWIVVLKFIPGFSMRATTHTVGTAIERATAPRAIGSFERAVVSAIKVKAKSNEGDGANKSTNAGADDCA
jgi:hypothetical protein